MSRIHYLILPLAMLVMYLVFTADSKREIQQPVPTVAPDWLYEMRREVQRQAIVNPMQGYQPQMPGANK
jgi:hypothetical protein